MDNKKKEFLNAYDSFAPAILRHIYFRVNNTDLAKDLAQETFFKAWRYLVSEREPINNYRVFLYKIAGNLIIDYYRQKQRIPISLDSISPDDFSEDPAQEEEAQKTFDKELVGKYIRELKDEPRQIMLYRYVDGFSIKDISDLTGKTSDNISVIIHRAVKFLKGKLYDRS